LEASPALGGGDHSSRRLAIDHSREECCRSPRLIDRGTRLELTFSSSARRLFSAPELARASYSSANSGVMVSRAIVHLRESTAGTP
jgi:hypothetical protein